MNILHRAGSIIAFAFLTACASLTQPGQHRMEPATPNSNGSTETVILDGFWGWHTRWEGLRKRIEKNVGPCRIWRYDNTGRVSIEALAQQLASDLHELKVPFNAIGYSMGGLVVREAIRQDPSLRLQRAVMLNSPHLGSMVANLVPMLPACREMRPSSPFIRRLAAAPWQYPTFVTWCPGDLMVFPGNSARWNQATVTMRCDVPAHEWPVISGGIHRSVVNFLAQE